MGSAPANLKHDSHHQPDRELAELRALLLGQQVVELQALQQRLDDPNIRAEETSQILGRAVALSLKHDGSLQRSFYPVVEQALKISIARNPAILASSLAPIIGEAVRKAVANAFRTMAESINFMLERSLSWESMKWRIEAMRTGKSFGEIALLRSLRYKVQQVFLIQRQTGLVLQYLAAPGEGISEAELASSMLTALGDFVSDAFTGKQSQELGVVQTDDFTLWVNHGSQATLAATVMGTPPPELKNVFARENELIHKEFAGVFANFTGDSSLFDDARPHLKNCLLGQSVRPQKKAWWWLLALVSVLIAIGVLGLFVHRRNRAWSDYLARLQSEPGIVVTGSQRSWGKYAVTGLRDPLAADPVKLAADFGIDPARVTGHFEPYQSLDRRFALQREIESEKEALEQLVILFPVNSGALQADQAMRMDSLEGHLNKLQQAAGALGWKIHVTIRGRADQTGAESKNVALSTQRAEQVFSTLRERGVPAQLISVVGLGNSEPIRHGSEAYQLEVNRSVSLKVELQQ